MFYTPWALIQLFVRENRPQKKFDKEIVEILVDVMAASGPTLHTYAIPKEVIKNDDDSSTLVLKMGKNYTIDAAIWAIGQTS